ncbi:MAG: NifU family protein [bacterium]|nr:NifU family protein [bacterium]
MLKFTDAAQAQLKEMLQGQNCNNTGIRLKITGDTQVEPILVELDKLEAQEEPLRDPITHFFVEYEGFMVVVDREAQPKLANATIQYESGGALSGQWTFDNPEPIPDQVYQKLDLNDPTVQKVVDLLEREINPGLAMHGGRAELINVLDHKVYLRFGGGCQGCSMIDATVKQGIETRLKEAIPDIVGVVDETDHAAGANPFFQ